MWRQPRECAGEENVCKRVTKEFQNGTIWVTGAGGLIGSHIVRVAREFFPRAVVVPLTRSRLDLLDLKRVERHFRASKPGLVFHCAAMSRSPDCEASPSIAEKVNVDASRNLVGLCMESKLVFFSSDQVFDGKTPPYSEAAQANPLSVYAETKVKAEQIVLANPAHLVIRTSLNGGPSPTGDRGFNEQMRKAWETGRELTLFVDEFRCAIHAEETARVACELALRGCSGVFHVAGRERMSRWDLGRLVAERWPGLKPRFKPGRLADYKGPPRPQDLALDCRKAVGVLGREIPGISEWLSIRPEDIF